MFIEVFNGKHVKCVSKWGKFVAFMVRMGKLRKGYLAMFEALELGRKVSKETYKEQEPEIRTQLLEVQGLLKEANIPVIIIVSGVEGAGKGEVVNRLNEWLDTRDLRTHAFWEDSDEERERPHFWRFWRKMPPRGTMGIMFGSWYTRPIVNRVFEEISDADLDAELSRIVELEHMLSRDGVLVVKFWFHLSKAEQAIRIHEDDKKFKRKKEDSLEQRFAEHYDRFAEVSEAAIRQTDGGKSPWYLIEASSKLYRDLTVGRTLIDAIRHRLKHNISFREPDSIHRPLPPEASSATVTILDQIDLSESLSNKDYKSQLKKYQNRLGELTWAARNLKRSSVAVFEGWDAAGKGGAIRRITASMDARLYRTISIASPTDEELAQHYLWRFWRHIPQAGYVTIYDRSWYGRVLVERVEGFAKDYEWMRSYQEINSFEEQMYQHGTVINKFWIHISQEEQLKRFKEREKVAWKQYKITDEDWRNREKWDDYKEAVNEMVARTSTNGSRWHIIPGNDKRFARVAILKTLCQSLEEALD